MRRPLSAVIAAACGVIGLVVLKTPHGDVLPDSGVAAPDPGDPDASADAATPAPGATATTGGVLRPAPTGEPAPEETTGTTPDQPTTRTVVGSREAAADHGYVQVEITMAGSELTDITLLEVTTSPKKAVRDAPGILIEEALEAQSADIDNVSGATYTSEAFKDSLRSALAGA